MIIPVLVKTCETIHWRIANQYIKVRTSLVNVYNVVNVIHVIHVYFVMLNASITANYGISSQWVEQLFISPLAIINSVVRILSVWVTLIITYYPCLRLRVVHFAFRNHFTCAMVLFMISLLTLVRSNLSLQSENWNYRISVLLLKMSMFLFRVLLVMKFGFLDASICWSEVISLQL